MQIISPRPGLEDFIRHAERYGTECVAETAESFLSESAMARLRVDLDELDRKQRGKHGFTVGRRRRRSADETAAAIVRLSVEGMVVPAIADKVGVSDAYVKRILRA